MALLRRIFDASVHLRNLLPPAIGLIASLSFMIAGFVKFAILACFFALATWVILVARTLRAPSLSTILNEDPPLESVQLARAKRSILIAADQVRSAAAGHHGVLSTSLLDVVTHCNALVTASSVVASRGDALFRFLRIHDPSELRRMADEHTRAARGMRDPEVAGSLRSAADAKRRQLETLEELRTLYDRILAELLAVEATLGELHARVVKLTFDDPAHAVTMAGSVNGELESIKQRVQRLERSAAATLRELSG